MSRPKLLYLSVNDGTDTRISKEIATLDREFDVTFVGVRQEDNGPNRLPASVRQHIVPGKRRNPSTLWNLARLVFRLRPSDYDSVHVVNENLLLTLAPLLLSSRRVVLDVFDSMFLKDGPAAGPLRGPLQWFAHALADNVLVTDDVRRGLIPGALRSNVLVLPNYPEAPSALPPRRRAAKGDPLRIFFSGSLALGRGVRFLRSLLEGSPSAEIVAAGWIYDEAAKELCAHSRVKYHGIVSMEEAARLACQCDYILCMYSPDVPNNIYASPNKIYDSALLGVPVIINREVRASEFVAANDLGVVLAAYDFADAEAATKLLLDYRDRRVSRAEGSGEYTWQRVDAVLLDSHQN